MFVKVRVITPHWVLEKTFPSYEKAIEEFHQYHEDYPDAICEVLFTRYSSWEDVVEDLQKEYDELFSNQGL